MPNGEGGIGASWKDKFKNFGKDLNDRRQEGGVITHATQVKDAAVDVGKQVVHGVGEEVTRLSGGIGVVGDRLNQAGQYIDRTADNIVASAKKDLSPDVVVAGAKKFGFDLLGDIQRNVQDIIGRNLGKAGTFYNDTIAPGLRRVGVDAKNASPINAYDLGQRSETIDPADKAEVKASERIEGKQLIEEVMGSLKAAVEFDQMKDEAVSALLEKAMGSTELAKKAGPALLKGLVAVMLEGSNFSGKTSDAMSGLNALLADEDSMRQLEEKQISIKELSTSFRDALQDISSKRELVMKSRGKDKNLSWEYEGDLVKASEAAQEKAIDLGWEVLDLLPASAAQLDMDKLVAAKVKAKEFAGQVNNDVMNPLFNVAKSMEKRFPDRVNEIRASLSKVLAKWTESKGVARQLMNEVKVDGNTTARIEEDILGGILGKNDMLNALPAGQQQEVMLLIGARAKAETDPVQYDRVTGGLYDKAVVTAGEYARLATCYDYSREYVKTHPEAADVLMILAENVMQAKSRMQLAQDQVEAELLVQAHKAKNKNEFSAQRQGNLASEAADRVANKERYAMLLDRYNQRVQREAPTVKKIAMLLGVAGFSVVIAKEAGPGAVDAMIEMAKFIAKVVADNVPMVTRAVGLGAGLSAPVLLWNWAREKMGKKAGENAYKELGKAEDDKEKALKQLQTSYDQLISLGQTEPAAKIKEIMDNLKGGNS